LTVAIEIIFLNNTNLQKLYGICTVKIKLIQIETNLSKIKNA
jgi:hypothetical protein